MEEKPLVDMLRQLIIDEMNNREMTITAFSRLVRLDRTNALKAIINGERKWVRSDSVDRLLSSLGYNYKTLYEKYG